VGPDTLVFLRARNRGRRDAGGRARLFWSEPAMFLHPKWWNEVGESVFSRIPGNGVGLADEPLPWRGDLPTGDAVSWIAVFVPDDGSDPPDLEAAGESTEAYLALCRSPRLRALSVQHRSIAKGDRAAFRVLVRGLPDAGAAETHFVEFGTDLPGDTLVRVGIQGEEAPFVTTVAKASASPLGVPVSPGEEIALDVELAPPATLLAGRYTFRLDQVRDERPLGRMNLVVDVTGAAVA
jgi:hypothetical protein